MTLLQVLVFIFIGIAVGWLARYIKDEWDRREDEADLYHREDDDQW